MKGFFRSITLLISCTFLLLISCGDKKSNKKPDSSSIKENQEVVKEEIDIKEPVIMFYGNSLTAGYGLDEENSFPSRIDDTLTALGLKYEVINAGLSGETTSGGLKRIDWVLNQKVDFFFLELGANDMLRGLPLEQTEANLRAIIQQVKSKYPDAKIALCEMLASPNMGKDYADSFQKIYADIASEMNVVFVPFFLNGVAGNPSLILPDGKHPNAEGQKIVAANIWKTLKEIL